MDAGIYFANASVDRLASRLAELSRVPAFETAGERRQRLASVQDVANALAAMRSALAARQGHSTLH